ncbi:transposase [Novosphingobium sp. Gsoil 351]|uniref:transposase n=1 Tax=Novosphingobium sp. Gsoil 351 TaxID=2675225 RepID=UPI001E3E3A0F|nr:transposase [Novosphingobium sp. Gsoil 351]
MFSGPERRRRWREEERLRILAEAFSPSNCVAGVYRRHDVFSALIYIWRRKHREEHAEPAPGDLTGPGFAEAMVVDAQRSQNSPAKPTLLAQETQ